MPAKSFPRHLRVAEILRQIAALSSPPPVSDDSVPTDLDALWRATQERLRASVPESTYTPGSEPLEPVGSDGDTLYLKAPEAIGAWAERRYSALIAAVVADCGTQLMRV